MRYLILIILNLPIVFIAYINVFTNYKLNKIGKGRLYRSLLLWTLILLVLVWSFPVYNILSNKSLFDSSDLTLFDIAETTTIIYLIYIINSQRQKIDKIDSKFKELVQELSILLSKK